MKKLVTLLLAAGLVFAAAQPSAAQVQFKPYGQMNFQFATMANVGNQSSDSGNAGMAFLSAKDWPDNFADPEGMLKPIYDADGILIGGEMVKSIKDDKGNDVYAYPPEFANKNQQFQRFVQRTILGVNIVASEQLSGTYDVVAGNFTWGGGSGSFGPGQGGGVGARPANIGMRQAFLDWNVPGSLVKVRMGTFFWSVPNHSGMAAGYAADDTGTGIQVTVPFSKEMGLTVGWLRSSGGNDRNFALAANPVKDNGDFFVVALPVRLDKVANVTPWGVYANFQKGVQDVGSRALREPGWINGTAYRPLPGAVAAGESLAIAKAAEEGRTDFEPGAAIEGNAFWAGLGFEFLGANPLTIGMDVSYSGYTGNEEYMNRSGFVGALSVAFRTPMMVPTLKAWYSTGDDGKVENGSERPLIYGGFNPGSNIFGYNGSWDQNMSTGGQYAGTLGASVQLNNVTFVKGLSHNFAVSYIAGTNSPDMAMAGFADPRNIASYMTTNDSVIAIDLSNNFMLYQNLRANLSVGYAIPSFDEDTWFKKTLNYRTGEVTTDPNARVWKFVNAWHAAVNFNYNF